MTGIKLTSCFTDGSGYAEFARGFASSTHLFQKDVGLTLQTISFEQARPDIGPTHKQTLGELENKPIDYQVKVILSIPDVLPNLVETGKKNVCFTMFETSRIPAQWVEKLNTYTDAVFVPCQWNKEVFQKSGVKKPIHVVFPGLYKKEHMESLEKVDYPFLSNISEDIVSFYSIFQWTERKNPDGLIKAYLAAFDGVEDVCLVLKTYSSDTGKAQQEHIKGFVARIKNNIRLNKPPKILFIGDLLTNNQIAAIHKRCNCFVLPHRAEGWGMPHMEAMAFGNPIITTGFSGNMDFCTKENSYLLDSQPTIVSNMPWIPFYEADMEWAEPNLCQLKDYMREVYNDLKKGGVSLTKPMIKGDRAQRDILEKFNWETSSACFVKACKEVING